MTDKEKGKDFCVEQNGKLCFASDAKIGEDVAFFNMSREEVKEICQIIPQCDEVKLKYENL